MRKAMIDRTSGFWNFGKMSFTLPKLSSVAQYLDKFEGRRERQLVAHSCLSPMPASG